LIEDTVIIGKYVLIPRIPLIPTDFAFEFKRVQFPVRFSFAMAVDKSQGQDLNVCGINLNCRVFRTGGCM
jgi:PIF1 helicase.